MRWVPGVDFSLIDGIAGSIICIGESACCTDTGSTAVSARLKTELGSLAVEGQDEKF